MAQEGEVIQDEVASDDVPEELRRQLDEMQQKEDQRVQELQAACDREMAAKLSQLDNQFQENFNVRMKDMEERYHTHTSGQIQNRQTDVLRTNKVIREISRALGGEWRPVFKRLMIDHPADEVQRELNKIEQHRAFIQGYKMLNTWKELKGDNFDCRHLVSALRDCNLPELADQAFSTLAAEGDDLFTIGRLRTRGGAAEDAGGGAEAGMSNSRTDGDAGASGGLVQKSARPVSMLIDSEPLEGPLPDRKLLALARRLGKKWHGLGLHLGVPEEELNEIRQNESGDYQAAFKTLWTWRDRVENDPDDMIPALRTALEQVGHVDLAQTV